MGIASDCASIGSGPVGLHLNGSFSETALQTMSVLDPSGINAATLSHACGETHKPKNICYGSSIDCVSRFSEYTETCML
jgi:hypothetical protein